MTIRDARREDVLARAADYLLQQGLSGGSLRRIAAATGTSDRMLLYYFRDKDELMAEILTVIAGRLAALLDTASGSGRLGFEALLGQLREVIRGDALRPYMRLWLELCAKASNGEEPYRGIGGGIADAFIDWADQRLDDDDHGPRRARAALLVATIDGLALLDAIGRGELADPAIAR